MHVLEHSRSLSCTCIVTQDFKLIGLTAAVVSKLLQIKCINTREWDSSRNASDQLQVVFRSFWAKTHSIRVE